ncbi:Z1 domain-containing protein [Carnobacterium sp.]|uniref:Z1 domain-containing protein n=1 Tax=Carnobacterium sp. TaxID=48221 RepID=UPI002FC9F374
MDFSSDKYEQLKELVQFLISSGQTWEQIAKFSDAPFPPQEILKTELWKAKIPSDEFTLNDWENLVQYMKNQMTVHTFSKLTKRAKNDAVIPTNNASQWVRYKKHLKESKFSNESIQEIQNSVYSILQQLDKETINGVAVKGLVVGEVQSGKTANMAGLISMAADYGFNYFIIFSGIIENLRKQTEDRMYNDLKNVNSKFSWNRLENPSIRKNRSEFEFRWENIELSPESGKKYFTVCLKQKTRMKDLMNWIYHDENKVKQLKVLIIDDEADQASINTNDVSDEFSKTSINEAMIKIVNGFDEKKLGASNYISYTATPYANVLNEIGENTLYPSDFIISLTPSPDYIGAKKLFGLEEPEQTYAINAIRTIPEYETLEILEIHKGNETEIPSSLKRAFDWFFVSSCALRVLNFRKPLSMLIHTSHLKDHHANINRAIQNYLTFIHSNQVFYLEKLEKLYIQEQAELTRQSFIDGMPDYSNTDEIPKYPKWEDVKIQIQSIFLEKELFSYTKLDEHLKPEYHKGFHIAVDNSSTSIPRNNDEYVRLAYPNTSDKLSFAPMFIIIGGNTLSRGLTLEGLTTSYFCRTTNLGDTLMQMARWFGYRKKYEIFPRIWLNALSIERFGFLSQLNEELREEIKGMEERNLTPSEWAVRLKNSPALSFVRITAANKMQSSQELDLDYSGTKPQTTIFESDRDIQKENLIRTEVFLNKLSSPDISRIKQGRLIWRDVQFDKISEFLGGFHFNPRTELSGISALLDWYQKAVGEAGYRNWSVVLSSKGEIPKATELSIPLWDIHGYSPQSVLRSRRNQPSDSEANIGILRTLRDEIIDIPGITNDDLNNLSIDNIYKIRKDHSYENVPQLVIYRIDKGKDPIKTGNGKSSRFPLNFEEDIIGIYLKIPGVKKSTSLAKHVAVKIPKDKVEKNDYVSE